MASYKIFLNGREVRQQEPKKVIKEYAGSKERNVPRKK